ncbi:MAG TPA: hypothetical protein VN701_01705, partial [Candidatus Paceibacterota bacterium]|nr:hypothetical protein [Candidatus Paceibacterota bacterium]
GAGGAGIANSISGSTAYYAGGGGGGAWTAGANNGAGGIGGGGAGGTSSVVNGSNGTANTGGGGGGAYSSTGGTGGSGIVIVSYDPNSGTSGGLTSTDISGTRAITATQKTVFTLSCSLGSSTQQKSVTVDLLPVVKEN